MNNKNIYILSFLFFVLTSVQAQNELGIGLLSNNLVGSRINPALLPNANLVIGLPNVGSHIYHSSGSINDILVENNEDGLDLNIGKWLSKVKATNQLNFNTEVESLHFYYQMKNLGLQLSHEVKLIGSLTYPEAFARFFGEGNAKYIGQKVNIGPSLELTAYQAISLGLSYTFNEKLTLSLRPKILLGAGSVKTQKHDVFVETDPDFYQISIDTDYEVYSVGGILEYDDEFNFGSPKYSETNMGFGLDLGLAFQATDKLNIHASWIDAVGTINWENKVKTYSSQQDTTYSGFNLSFDDLLQGETINFDGDSISFDNIFDFTESNDDTYSTTLPSRIYVGADYQINDKFTVKGLFYNEVFKGKSAQAFAVGVQAQVVNMVNVGVNYNYRFNTVANLGFNTTIDLGPVQLFAVTDNIINMFQLGNAEDVNGRVGINLVFSK